jgi:hypothetical protein
LARRRWCLKIIRHLKASNDQFVDFQSPDCCAADGQSTDDESTKRDGADGDCTERQGTDCK